MIARPTGAVLLALASLTAFAGAAQAQTARGPVAVLSVEITGDAPPQLRNQLQRSLAGGLGAGGARVVPLEQVSAALASRPELTGCSSTTCLAEIGALVSADTFVKARVDAAGSTYLIELELLSATADSAVVSRVERECTVCSIVEANDRMSEAARDLLKAEVVRSVVLRVSSTPRGATVEVDGVEVGSTPFEGELEPGEHRISVTKDGFADGYRTVDVDPRGDAGDVDVEFELTPAEALVEAVVPAARPYETLKWAAAGGAVIALATGVTLLAIDGNEVACNPDPFQTACPKLRETTALGAVFLVASAGLGGTSAWMFLRDRDGDAPDSGPEPGVTAAIAPLAGGGMAAVHVRF